MKRRERVPPGEPKHLCDPAMRATGNHTLPSAPHAG